MKGMLARRGLTAGAAVAALCLSAAPVLAQSDDGPSQSAMVNLIRLLVKQKVITQQSADALLKEAEQEAARARSAKVAVAPVPIPEEPLRAPEVRSRPLGSPRSLNHLRAQR